MGFRNSQNTNGLVLNRDLNVSYNGISFARFRQNVKNVLILYARPWVSVCILFCTFCFFILHSAAAATVERPVCVYSVYHTDCRLFIWSSWRARLAVVILSVCVEGNKTNMFSMQNYGKSAFQNYDLRR